MLSAISEGAEVKQGDLLFEIDPKPYQAQYDQAQSQVALYQAQVKEAQADYNRNKLVKTSPAVSQQDLDRYLAVLESIAAVAYPGKFGDLHKIPISATAQVESPIDGQVSRYYLTVGNLVNQDQTQLTTVVSLDPMYVYFGRRTTYDAPENLGKWRSTSIASSAISRGNCRCMLA